MYIVELLTPAYDVAWLPWAVLYFFFIGISVNSAWMAAVVSFARAGTAWHSLVPSLMVTLLLSSIIAPIVLLADLHQPGRFWHFYAYPTVWSWMSIGSFLLPMYLGMVFLMVFSWWRGKVVWMRLCALPLIFTAATIAVYTGVEVMVVKARPLWHTPFLPINFLITGWLSALGAMLSLNYFLPQSAGMRFSLPLFRDMMKWAWSISFIVAAIWMLHGIAFRTESLEMAWSLLQSYPVWRFSVLLALFSSVGIAVLAFRAQPLSSSHTVLLAFLLLVTGWLFRWVIFMQVQGVPKYGAGLYLYEIPWGTGGWLGMIGILGLLVCLISLLQMAMTYFPVQSFKHQQ